MTRQSDAALRRGLVAAGLSGKVVDAAWPVWRTDTPPSPSGDAELRFALSRRLGLSPRALIEDRVEFVWRDTARFKHLSVKDPDAEAAVTSFGMTLARLLVAATPQWRPLDGLDAAAVRRSLLGGGKPFVDLAGLVSFCWAVGIPVVHLRVFPLKQKSMHAMVVRVDGRPAILLGRAASFPAQTAFTLAHELAHVLLGHLDGTDAVVDLEDPARAGDHGDDEEAGADRAALEILTGSPDPEVTAALTPYNAPALAQAVLEAGPRAGIEPGTLALTLAHRTREWAKVMSALRFIYGGRVEVAAYVNAVADGQLDWDLIPTDGADYVRRIIGIDDAGDVGPGVG